MLTAGMHRPSYALISCTHLLLTDAELETTHAVPCSLRMVPSTPDFSTTRTQRPNQSAAIFIRRKRTVEVAGMEADDRQSCGCPPGRPTKTVRAGG
jgi:hypothetical protein